jgi:hypothetical protein
MDRPKSHLSVTLAERVQVPLKISCFLFNSVGGSGMIFSDPDSTFQLVPYPAPDPVSDPI